MKNTTKRVAQFLDDAFSHSHEKAEWMVMVQNLVMDVYPDAQAEIKYGGLVFSTEEALICGIFLSQKHMSVEFGLGYQFLDTDGCLEGSGKFRRHLKIRNVGDIESKQVRYFLTQAFSED